MTDSTQTALIGYLHRQIEERDRLCSKLTNELTAYRDAISAIAAAARYSDAPITPGFLRQTIEAYGLHEANQ